MDSRRMNRAVMCAVATNLQVVRILNVQKGKYVKWSLHQTAEVNLVLLLLNVLIHVVSLELWDVVVPPLNASILTTRRERVTNSPMVGVMLMAITLRLLLSANQHV
jgi:hypothetical protein